MLALFAGVRTVYSKKYNKFFGYSYTNFIHSFYQQALNWIRHLEILKFGKLDLIPG